VHAQPNGLNHARLGVTVSRRVALRANRRNHIKRIIRESFRAHQAALGGLDLVVVAREPARSATPDQLRASLNRHWKVFYRTCEPHSFY
jgi:ribonuclease P protein component